MSPSTRSCACSGRAAAASRRCCGRWPGSNPWTAGGCCSTGATRRACPRTSAGVGLMFQDHQLFPQRDVGGNVAFGLRMHGGHAANRTSGYGSCSTSSGCRAPGGRAVASLSGGEQQRVALARALAPRPRLLMLDEPLGQLDRSLRERLVVELRELFGRLGTTVLAVTHDQGEAFALADRVVVMRDGRIAQSGTPLEVWQRPADEFVARFLGFDNVVEATVGGRGRGHAVGQGAGARRTPRRGCAPCWCGPPGVRLVRRRRGPALHGGRAHLPGHPCRRTAAARGGAPRLEAACALRDGAGGRGRGRGGVRRGRNRGARLIDRAVGCGA